MWREKGVKGTGGSFQQTPRYNNLKYLRFCVDPYFFSVVIEYAVILSFSEVRFYTVIDTLYGVKLSTILHFICYRVQMFYTVEEIN